MNGGPDAVGVGYASAHHGELLQGVFENNGHWRRALVTLPLPDWGSRAVFIPSSHDDDVTGLPGLVKSRRAAVLTLRELRQRTSPVPGGRLEITGNVPHGVGMGSSTSDVTATIRAVANHHGLTMSREDVGRLAVQAESASDSIMFDDRVVLFAHRDGMVLENLGHQLPPLVVVGANTQPGASVDTLRCPPAEYHDDELACFRVLRAGLRRAVATADVALLGRVATASARINQRFLPKPSLPDLVELCRRLGGAGVQVAHSGTVAGLIFDARRPGIEDSVAECRAGIDALGLPVTAVIRADRADLGFAPDRGSVTVGYDSVAARSSSPAEVSA
jgi:uncharacterized protein involved in propanediol utilization